MDFFYFVILFVIVVFMFFVFGIDFDINFFLFIVFIYLFIVIEMVGDFIVNSLFCKELVSGLFYLFCICGGILGDGFNLILVGVFNIFFNIIFG